MTVNSQSPYSLHVERLKLARERVHAAQVSADAAIAGTVAAHYADRAAAAPQTPTASPDAS